MSSELRWSTILLLLACLIGCKKASPSESVSPDNEEFTSRVLVGQHKVGIGKSSSEFAVRLPEVVRIGGENRSENVSVDLSLIEGEELLVDRIQTGCGCLAGKIKNSALKIGEPNELSFEVSVLPNMSILNKDVHVGVVFEPESYLNLAMKVSIYPNVFFKSAMGSASLSATDGGRVSVSNNQTTLRKTFSIIAPYQPGIDEKRESFTVVDASPSWLNATVSKASGPEVRLNGTRVKGVRFDLRIQGDFPPLFEGTNAVVTLRDSSGVETPLQFRIKKTKEYRVSKKRLILSNSKTSITFRAFRDDRKPFAVKKIESSSATVGVSCTTEGMLPKHEFVVHQLENEDALKKSVITIMFNDETRIAIPVVQLRNGEK